MTRSLLPILFASTCGAATGCSGPSIREGIWELEFDLHFSQTEEEARHLIETREVEVRVEPADRQAAEDVLELIEIIPLDEDENLKRMFGDLKEGRVTNRPTVVISHTDRDWTFQLFGFVKHSQHVEGTRCMARTTHDHVSLEGRWRMRWLRDT